MVKKMCLVMLSMCMLTSCIGCVKEGPEKSVIDQRRDAAESYMRRMATYMWRAGEDITYTRTNTVRTDEDLANYDGTDYISIKAGRLYRGIPYSYSGASAWNFYDYATKPDDKGIAAVSGIHWSALNGVSRVGNDCSGAIQLAWDYVGSDIMAANTSNMTKMYGYLPVGEYTTNDNKYTNTKETCQHNGVTVMHQAYTGLQKADAVVKRESSWGHTMMIVENHVEQTAGGVDGEKSYVTVLHQTTAYVKKEAKAFDPEYGEDVYQIYGIDDKYTYNELYKQGYLPVTCDVFTDAGPVTETVVNDSETEYGFDNILQGTVVSNRLLSSVTITITDETGETVMEGTCYALRQTGRNIFSFDLSRFQTEVPELQRGRVAPEELTPGNYHCTHVVRDAHGEYHTMRDFDFAVPEK